MNYAGVIDEIFSQFHGTKFGIRLWDGQEYTYGKGSKEAFTLVFDSKKTVKRLLAQGALGFGESYMDGSLRIEGDIEAYLRMRHQFKHVRRSYNLVQATLLSNIGIPRSRNQQIAFHYDLGNDFFKMLLDPNTMSYSAGRYKTGTESLNKAQENKLELVCNWLDLPPKSTILDLGFGWGGFVVQAAMRKWQVTGYTLSKTQLTYSKKLIKLNKLERLVTLKYRDMLDNLPPTEYDAVVLIESVEHVGKERLADYFKQLYVVVKPGGSLYVQATGQYRQKTADKWVLKYVFPGGYLPSLGELVASAGAAGFAVDKLQDDTSDYLHTMTKWIENLESHRQEIEDMFGEPFYRLWELWMHGAKVAFEVNYMNLFRIHFKKPD